MRKTADEQGKAGPKPPRARTSTERPRAGAANPRAISTSRAGAAPAKSGVSPASSGRAARSSKVATVKGSSSKPAKPATAAKPAAVAKRATVKSPAARRATRRVDTAAAGGAPDHSVDRLLGAVGLAGFPYYRRLDEEALAQAERDWPLVHKVLELWRRPVPLAPTLHLGDLPARFEPAVIDDLGDSDGHGPPLVAALAR